MQLTKNKENDVSAINHNSRTVANLGAKQRNLHQQWATEYLQDIPFMEGNDTQITNIHLENIYQYNPIRN